MGWVLEEKVEVILLRHELRHLVKYSDKNSALDESFWCDRFRIRHLPTPAIMRAYPIHRWT